VSINFDEILFDSELIRTEAREKFPVSAQLEFGNSQPRNAQTGIRQTNVGRLDAIEGVTVDLGLLDDTDRRYFINFIRGGQGSAIGCRVYLPHDHTATLEAFATGNGVLTSFPLYLTYLRPGPATHMAGGAAHPDVRRIFKPVVQVAKEKNSFQLYEADGVTARVPEVSFKIYFGAVEQPTGWTVDCKTGTVYFTVAPSNGTVIKWSGVFDVPMAFDGNTFAQHFDVPSSAQYVMREMLGPELGLT
jgi:hypothetical protein